MSRHKNASPMGAIIAAIFAALVMFATVSVSAQTGSRLRSSTFPKTVFWFGEPGEIREVRVLLNRGEVDKAIGVAEDFLHFLDTSGSVLGGHITNRYFALNALCVALTAGGRLGEALAECSKAVDLSGKRWQAYNSRGVVYYLEERMDDALADYRAALSLVKAKSGSAGIIRHNIELAEARKGVS